MDEQFHQLEMRLKTLLQKHEKLQLAHANLKQSHTILEREKELLMQKNRIAVTHIESMVSRLKLIEKSS